MMEGLQEIYLKHPADVDTAAHLGFSHIWRIAEAVRLERRSASITDEVILARKYFGEAARLAPEDARFQGFYAGATLAEGIIHGDEKLKRTGYFKEAVDYEWRTLDLCAGTGVDRSNPDFSPYMAKETHEGHPRACWNSWSAPHEDVFASAEV